MFKRWFAALACVCALAVPVHAGVTGHYSTGADIIDNATIPPPGFYMKNYLINYHSSSLRDGSGHKVGGDFKIDTTVLVNRFLYVTEATFLGADFAMHAVVPLVHADITNPFGDKGKETGVGDVLLEPILLGWHGDQWDAAASVGVFLPTGRWERTDVANIGKDMYTVMFTTGLTWYFDTERTLRTSGVLRYETHTENRTLNMHQGDDMTFEWTVSKKLWKYFDLGVSGYAQWQVTTDRGKDVYWGTEKDRVFAAGPELKVSIPCIQGSLSLNYMKEFGARDRTQGDLWALSFAMAF